MGPDCYNLPVEKPLKMTAIWRVLVKIFRVAYITN